MVGNSGLWFYFIMKRHGNLFNKIISYENIYQGYRNARRGKGWQDTIKRFESNLDENLKNIQESLTNRTFTTSEYNIFTPTNILGGK